MARTVHVALSVRGALRWNKRRLKALAECIEVDGEHPCRTAEDARNWLMDRLSEGKELLPMGDCPGFDFKTGCPGHECAAPAREGGPLGKGPSHA